MGKVIDDKELIAALRNAKLPVTYAYIADRLEALTTPKPEAVKGDGSFIFGGGEVDAAIGAALSPQEPVAGELPIEAWIGAPAGNVRVTLSKTIAEDWAGKIRPLTDHTEATRRIAELEAERNEQRRWGRAQLEEAQRAWNERDGEKRRAEKAEALNKTLSEALEEIAYGDEKGDYAEATRIIADLKVQRDQLHGRLFEEGECVKFYRAAAIDNRKRAEKAEAFIAETRGAS